MGRRKQSENYADTEAKATKKSKPLKTHLQNASQQKVTHEDASDDEPEAAATTVQKRSTRTVSKRYAGLKTASIKKKAKTSCNKNSYKQTCNSDEEIGSGFSLDNVISSCLLSSTEICKKSHIKAKDASYKSTTIVTNGVEQKATHNYTSDDEPEDKATTVQKRSTRTNKKRSASSKAVSKRKKAKTCSNKNSFKQTSNSDNEIGSGCSLDSGLSSCPLSSTEIREKSHIKVDEASCSKSTNIFSIKNELSSSESEWEEVEENEQQSLEDYQPEIPKEGVQITIDCPELSVQKRKRNKFDVMDYIRLQVNRSRKEAQISVHKTHLLCLLSHGFYLNTILNSSLLKSLTISMLPLELLNLTKGKKVEKVDYDGIERIIAWFKKTFGYEATQDSFLDFSNTVVKYFDSKICLNVSEYNLVFIAFARTLGLKTRLCISFYPVTHKANNLIKKNKTKEEIGASSKECDDNGNCTQMSKAKKESNSSSSNKILHKCKESIPKLKNLSKTESKPKQTHSKRLSARVKSYKLSSDEDDTNGDRDFDLEEDFEKTKIYRKRSSKLPKQHNRKIVSSDSDPSSPTTAGFQSDQVTCWAEIFSKPDKEWIAVDCVNNIVNKPYEIEAIVPQPIKYIVAYDNKSYAKDVTKRYCSQYMTSTIKLRVDSGWWEETLQPYLPPSSKLDNDEEKNLETLLINKPLPSTVAGFKNHPLYALKRHLLKFEAIYPPDAPSVGFIRNEPAYPRECVVQLHSRETWLKEARVVRIGEEPYKIVKARPKWDKMAGVLRTDLPLEVFGFWQTEPYQPPIAVNGKVPRNEYGNVELFKPSMLPIGTVHLQLPGLNRIAKKLGIDCSSAVVGFDGHKGSVHPVFDGFVICEEYKETILAAWDEEQENTRKREEEKREKRIYGNWKKLIRGLLIRERIKLKYNTQ